MAAMDRARRGMTTLEVLLFFTLLSLALGPLFYLLSLDVRHVSEREVLAHLLSQHVMEQVVADRLQEPGRLPQMTGEESFHPASASGMPGTRWFGVLAAESGQDRPDHDPELRSLLSTYRYRVDTFYLQNQLYRVVAFVGFDEGGRRKQVFLERLLGQRPADQPWGSEPFPLPAPPARLPAVGEGVQTEGETSKGEVASEDARLPGVDPAAPPSASESLPGIVPTAGSSGSEPAAVPFPPPSDEPPAFPPEPAPPAAPTALAPALASPAAAPLPASGDNPPASGFGSPSAQATSPEPARASRGGERP